MIETLFDLVKCSGVERMNLSIQAAQGNRVAVCIQCILGAEPKEATEEQSELRRALAMPILIEGLVGEVDAKLDEIVTGFVRAAAPITKTLVTNVGHLKEDLAKAGKKAANAKPADAGTTKEVGDDSGEVIEETRKEDEFSEDSAESL